MERRPLIVLGVVWLVVFAGCATMISSRDGSGPETVQPTTAGDTTTQEQTESATTTAESSTTATTEQTTQTSTTQEAWSVPKALNTPLEFKYEQESESRLESVSVAGTGSEAEGYSAVEVTVTANTSMPNLDPEDHGSVEGEPFIIIFMNGHLATSEDSRFATPRGLRVARTPILEYEDRGEFTLSVPKEAFEAGGAEKGDQVDLMIMVMDRDSEWDDIYGKQTVTVEYNPDAEGDAADG